MCCVRITASVIVNFVFQIGICVGSLALGRRLGTAGFYNFYSRCSNFGKCFCVEYEDGASVDLFVPPLSYIQYKTSNIRFVLVSVSKALRSFKV